MPDTLTDSSALLAPAEFWLSPLGDGQACGPDLEYDPEFLELAQASGKPESQFGRGEPPDWVRVREIAESLFTRTRDLRVALWWSRAKLNLDGFAALPSVLMLFHGLLENFWDDLHPMQGADDPDALARLSVIGSLDKLDSLLGDIRNSRLSGDGRLMNLRVRDVDVALGKLAPRPDEPPRTQGEVTGLLAQAADTAATLRAQTDAALASLKQLQSLMIQRFSADLVVDLASVRGMLVSIIAVLPASEQVVEVEPDSTQTTQTPVQQAGGVGTVASRQDAIRAIELVCVYLERCEPTNPAQLLLRRAARVINKDFLQLVRELAPDAVKDVARIMGVDPDTINDQN